MNKIFIVDPTCNNMRVDRWLRNKIGKIPQGLIEKTLRLGKIKINKKKVKSSYKIKSKDEINLFLENNLVGRQQALLSLDHYIQFLLLDEQ